MRLLCLLGIHRIKGCKCVICGKTFDKEHTWQDCKCSICGKTRDENHRWQGCVCTVCGKTRDEKHKWLGCTCLVCGRTRDEGHNWNGCKCSVCGKTRDAEHLWKIKLHSGETDWVCDWKNTSQCYCCPGPCETTAEYTLLVCTRCGEERRVWPDEEMPELSKS